MQNDYIGIYELAEVTKIRKIIEKLLTKQRKSVILKSHQRDLGANENTNSNKQ